MSDETPAAPFTFKAAAQKPTRAAPPEAPKRTRKPCAAAEPPKRPERKKRAMTIPMAMLPALAGMKEDEAGMLMLIMDNLNEVPKRKRARIVAALAKAFA